MQPAIRKFALVFFASLLFHVAGTWTMPLIDRDEPRFAEASREMMQRGDYVIPYLNNRYRFDKPPLTYWAQIASYRAFGETDFAARFPTTIAAAATALLLFAWGRRIAGERIGLWAALIFTISFQVFLHGKAAVADMWLVLFVTVAHWAGYELLRDRLGSEINLEPRKWWWIFYVALALAFLAKGPIGWTPLLTVAVAKFFLREVKLNSRFWFIPGLLLTVAIVALWGVPALVRTQGEFFNVGIGKHVVARSVVAMEGHGGSTLWSYLAMLPFYFALVFLSFAPWSIKLPWLAHKLWCKRDPLDNYLIAGAAVVFIVFTLVKTKLPHYTLPAFPLLALLLAKSLPALPTADRFVRRTALIALGIVLLAVCASPVLAKLSPSLQLMRQARADLAPEMEFGSVEYKEPSLIWYFRRHVSGWLTDLDNTTVQPFMEKPGGRFVVIPTSLATSLYPTLPAGWKSYTTRGVNSANGKWLDLTLILKHS
ncbi:MAG: glycosyltransferase family 39 protein [Verrucomicrobiota bacterium]|nr:glycosyltransferase family 39 protein [Verrucomicrobiota bacterium]